MVGTTFPLPWGADALCSVQPQYQNDHKFLKDGPWGFIHVFVFCLIEFLEAQRFFCMVSHYDRML